MISPTTEPAAATAAECRAWELLDTVHDPEIPSVSIIDLGIVREVTAADTAHVEVALTPTYSGCPAIETIEQDAAASLTGEFDTVVVRSVLQPAWTTDWMTERGRARLKAAGIAPPQHVVASPRTIASPLAMVGAPAPLAPTCPRCESADVERIAEFGSTSCKSLWRCRACREPFDHFKAH